MRQNLSIQPDNMSENGIKASCLKCGKGNPVTARFCGGCGSLVKADQPSQPAKIAVEKIKKEIFARKNPGQTTENNKSHQVQLPAEFNEAIATNNSVTRTPEKTVKILYKLSLKWRKRLAMALFSVLTCLVIIFLSGLMPAYKPFGARWLDFRAFLSRSFELTHSELDDIFSEALKIPADSKQFITPQQANQIEATLKTVFQKPDLSIFPNPFFEAPAVTTNGSMNAATSQKFADIPLSHPFYKALEPLLELGINFADKQNRVRPYEPITWNDWQNSVDSLFKLLMVEPDLSAEIATQRQGYMSNIDVRNYIEHLREKLFIKSNKLLVWSQEIIYPGRLEAFSVLASVIRELNANQ